MQQCKHLAKAHASSTSSDFEASHLKVAVHGHQHTPAVDAAGGYAERIGFGSETGEAMHTRGALVRHTLERFSGYSHGKEWFCSLKLCDALNIECWLHVNGPGECHACHHVCIHRPTVRFFSCLRV